MGLYRPVAAADQNEGIRHLMKVRCLSWMCLTPVVPGELWL